MQAGNWPAVPGEENNRLFRGPGNSPFWAAVDESRWPGRVSSARGKTDISGNLWKTIVCFSLTRFPSL